MTDSPAARSVEVRHPEWWRAGLARVVVVVAVAVGVPAGLLVLWDYRVSHPRPTVQDLRKDPVTRLIYPGSGGDVHADRPATRTNVFNKVAGQAVDIRGTDASPDMVEAFYAQRLAATGWRVSSPLVTRYGTSVPVYEGFVRGSRTVYVTISTASVGRDNLPDPFGGSYPTVYSVSVQ